MARRVFWTLAMHVVTCPLRSTFRRAAGRVAGRTVATWSDRAPRLSTLLAESCSEFNCGPNTAGPIRSSESWAAAATRT